MENNQAATVKQRRVHLPNRGLTHVEGFNHPCSGGARGDGSISAAQIVAAVSIFALGAINYIGVESGNRLQVALTVIKIAAISVLPVLAIALHPATLSLSPLVAPVAHPAAAFGIVMIAVMWAYEGWYYLPFSAGEIADAPRTVPRALVLGILAIVAIYLSVNVAYMLALPIDKIRGVERIAENAMTALIGKGGGPNLWPRPSSCRRSPATRPQSSGSLARATPWRRTVCSFARRPRCIRAIGRRMSRSRSPVVGRRYSRSRAPTSSCTHG